MKVKSESEVAESCLTLSDPMDCSPPVSSVHGIFQARVLEWGAITFSLKYLTSTQYCAQSLSHVQLFATVGTVALQALSMGIFMQEYWSGLPFPAPGDLPETGRFIHASCIFCVTGGFFTDDPLGKTYTTFNGHPKNSVI